MGKVQIFGTKGTDVEPVNVKQLSLGKITELVFLLKAVDRFCIAGVNYVCTDNYLDISPDGSVVLNIFTREVA